MSICYPAEILLHYKVNIMLAIASAAAGHRLGMLSSLWVRDTSLWRPMKTFDSNRPENLAWLNCSVPFANSFAWWFPHLTLIELPLQRSDMREHSAPSRANSSLFFLTIWTILMPFCRSPTIKKHVFRRFFRVLVFKFVRVR